MDLRAPADDVETRDYKGFVIRVEIYNGKDDKFTVWPYVEKAQGDSTTTRHFHQLDGVKFPTRGAALEAAIAEGQRRIDAGFDVRTDAQAEPLSPDELKAAAEKLGYTKIKRDGADWVPLKTWNGFSGGTNTPNFSVQVDYHLEGNRVRITRALDDQEYWYTLS